MNPAMRYRLPALSALFVLLALTLPAAAHPGHADPAASGGPTTAGGSGLFAGLAHPFTGADHLLAMVAVGLLAARLGGRSVWLLPTLFVGGMVAGGATAVLLGTSATVGGVEQMVAASVVALGLMLVGAGRLPRAFAVAAVPLFAVFHGYAHLAEGTEFAAAGFGTGMVLGTAVLHAAGVAFGLAVGRRTSAAWAWRVGGGAVAAMGLVLLVGTV